MSERRTIRLPSHGLALFVTALLLAQYAPLHEFAGAGPDHHCVECTENYCTRDRCFCGHEHRHDRSESQSASATPHGAVPHTKHHQHELGSAGEAAEQHRHHEDEHGSAGEAAVPQRPSTHGATDSTTPAAERAAPTIPAPTRNIAFRPCGSDDPLAVPVLQIDHFLLGDAHTGGLPADDRPRSTHLSVIAHPQMVGDDVFHPPAV